jgi:hypothetical protein
MVMGEMFAATADRSSRTEQRTNERIQNDSLKPIVNDLCSFLLPRHVSQNGCWSVSKVGDDKDQFDLWTPFHSPFQLQVHMFRRGICCVAHP